MKKWILTLGAAALALAASGVELAPKSWYLNPWTGYQPKAKLEIDKDGTLHVSEVKAKYGFGMISGTRIKAKAGDTVKLTAMIKGKGTMFFQLQYYDANNKWLTVAPTSARVKLTDEWREVTLSTKVENFKDKITAMVVCSVGTGKDGELYLKNPQAEVETSEFAGDYPFPRHWTVFAPVPASESAPLDRIPEEIAGVKGKPVPLDNNLIRMAPFFPEQKLRNTAWLYAELNAETAGDYTIGAGADYFMAIYVNGKCILDRLKTGNTENMTHFTNHKATAAIRKGKNIIAIKFQAGASKTPEISLGGAGDLRNLSSILTVTDVYQKDDYEKPGERSGDPKLIQDILTDGIETKTGQGVYRQGSVIRFDRTYPMPPKLGGKLFALGVRVHKFEGAGKLIYRIGSSMTMEMARANEKSDFSLTVYRDGKKLKSAVLPASALPSDVVFAVDANQYYVNAMSLQDSKLRSVTGNAAFAESAPFKAEIEVQAPSVTVDEFFTGLAKREVKSNTVPFKVALDAAFDPVKAGWKLIWQDEFNGTEVDWKNTWMNSPWDPKPRNRDMAYLKDGMLHIRAEFKPDPKETGRFRGRTVGMYSQKRFSYGYYEAKVRFTKKPGWWAAFWMLDEGRNMTVAGGYEIDIFEDYSTRGGKNMVANNLHVNFGPGNRSYGYHFPLPGSIDDFYIIGCKWTPFEISVYLNGKLIRSSSRHSPYQSVTYDAMNHGFGTSTLYLCISGQCGSSGGRAGREGDEEYLVDWVRAYEYPRENDPAITLETKPANSLVKTGEKIVFDVQSSPSARTQSPVKNVYLFDNGNLIDFKSGANGKFEIAIDKKHYAETIWSQGGRSGAKVVFDSYPHLFVAAVQDEKGQVAFTEPFPVIADMGPSKPYKGKMAQAPGVLKAAEYDEGGNGAASYKQLRGGGTFAVGREGLLSRKSLNLREGAEWVNYTFNATASGVYTLELTRQTYRREWPMRAMILMDGVYVGDLTAKEGEEKAVLKGIRLAEGTHRMTLISVCTYGTWATELEFKSEK
ncbi:MAG: family 16 glycosylhydrolase [Lentisphaeria bacterium]|nr:family 16 glycosylhydrolase [Lentisphaeria bacterium]